MTGADAFLHMDYSRGRAPAAQASALFPLVFSVCFVFFLFFLALEVLFPTQAFFYINCLAAVVFSVRAVLI